MAKQKAVEPIEIEDAGEDEVRQSSGQRVYSLLREQILSLKLPPNAELDEVQFSRELGFSRTPIREALIRLAADSLVVLAPNRGARVAPLDFDQVPQLIETLELYERATTRWAAQRRLPHHLDALERANGEFAAACETGDPRGWWSRPTGRSTMRSTRRAATSIWPPTARRCCAA